MKKSLFMLLGLSVCLALSGCASNKESTLTTTPSEEIEQTGQTEQIDLTAQTDQTQQNETRIFSTVNGDIEIPTNPQKIVTDYYLGEFLALNVKPIIASSYALDNPFLADYVDGIQPLEISSSETSLEMITAAEPDLIITLKEEDYEIYSKIAPTVLIPYGTYTDKELFLYIGDMLGKTSEAENYIADYEKKAADSKAMIQEIVGEKTVSLVEVWPKELYIMGSHFARGGSILYDLWELKAPEKIQTTMVDEAGTYEVVSLEVLPEYAGDFIIYGVLADTDSSFLEDSNIWNGLPAVQEERVMSYQQVAFMHSDPISLNGQMEMYIEFFNQYK